jgi:hypothetical protein
MASYWAILFQSESIAIDLKRSCAPQGISDEPLLLQTPLDGKLPHVDNEIRVRPATIHAILLRGLRERTIAKILAFTRTNLSSCRGGEDESIAPEPFGNFGSPRNPRSGDEVSLFRWTEIKKGRTRHGVCPVSLVEF